MVYRLHNNLSIYNFYEFYGNEKFFVICDFLVNIIKTQNVIQTMTVMT